jgi:hypothetical protein
MFPFYSKMSQYISITLLCTTSIFGKQIVRLRSRFRLIGNITNIYNKQAPLPTNKLQRAALDNW